MPSRLTAMKPEVAILGADQKEHGLWGWEWISGWMQPTHMRSVTFWGKFTSGSRISASLAVAICLNSYSRPQRPPSFWSAPRIATSGQVKNRKSAIHGLPVTLRMLRVKFDKSDWFWSHSIVFTNPFKSGMSLDVARGRDSWCWPKGARPLATRML